jgi:hypothetical protein
VVLTALLGHGVAWAPHLLAPRTPGVRQPALWVGPRVLRDRGSGYRGVGGGGPAGDGDARGGVRVWMWRGWRGGDGGKNNETESAQGSPLPKPVTAAQDKPVAYDEANGFDGFLGFHGRRVSYGSQPKAR